MRESSLCSQGNVGEFLLVDKRHINMGGTECNKIGAGISAYHMLRHKCGLTSQPWVLMAVRLLLHTVTEYMQLD